METPRKQKITQYEVDLVKATTVEQISRAVVKNMPHADPQWRAHLALSRLVDIQDPLHFDSQHFIPVFSLFKIANLSIGQWDLLFERIYTNTNGNKDIVKELFMSVLNSNLFYIYNSDYVVNIKGDQLLHFCVSEGKYSAVLPLLLEWGANIDAVNQFQESPLMLAMEAGNLDAVQFLLKHGANPKLQNMRGHNVLHIAATRWHHLFFESNIISILNEKGIQIDCPSSQLSEGYNTPLITAITHQNYDFCLNIVQQGCNVNSRLMSMTEDTALHLMVMKQNKIDVHFKVISSLLAAGAGMEACTKYPRKETPLVIALRIGCKKSVQKLLRMNAKPDVAYSRMCSRLIHCRSHTFGSNTNSMIEAMIHYADGYPQILLAAGYPLSSLFSLVCKLDQLHSLYLNSPDGLPQPATLNSALTSIACDSGFHAIEQAYMHLSSKELRYFRKRCSEPLSLSEYCRIAVRRCLPPGPAIYQQICTLELPVALQNFLMLDDILWL